MTRSLALTAAIVLLPLGACQEPEPPGAAEVRAAYHGYMDAAERGDGDGVVSYVAERSLDYYTWLIRLATDGARDQVLDLSPVDKFEIVVMRNRTALADLDEMDGADWLAHATDEGWFIADEEDPIALGRVSISGDFASATLLDQGRETGRFLDFYREDGRWKLDLQSWDNLWNEYIEEYAAEMDMSVNEYVIALERYERGLRPEVRRWRPMREW